MPRDWLTPLWAAARLSPLAPCDWELLFAQARNTRLMARLALHLRARGWRAEVPAVAVLHLDAAERFAERLQQEVMWEVEQVLAALQALDTPVVLLKGAAYVAAGLPPARGRLFSDVDVMVAREQLPQVESALLAAGWVAQKLTPYDDRYYRTWMHELPPLQHVQRRTVLDVHHTIAPPSARWHVDGASLLAAARPLADLPQAGVLQPVDMVLHSVVHLLQEGDFASGLRDLLDIDDLLRHFAAADADFWPALLQRAGELRLGVPLGHALAQVERLFGTAPPTVLAAKFSALGARSPARRSMHSLLTLALRPDHSSCDSRFTRLARWLLYVRSHWLRMPWYQIAPHLLRKAWTRATTKPPSPAPSPPPPPAPAPDPA